jgi:hypothetical protein
MSLWQKITQCGLLGALIVAICLAWYSSVLSSRLDTSKKLTEELNKSLAQQAGLIGTLQTQDAQNRALMAAQLAQEQKLRQQAIDTEGKYREAIKDNGCAAERMPDAAIDLLWRSPSTTATKTDSSITP